VSRPPLTPPEAEARLAALAARIEKGVQIVHDLDEKAARLRREFDHAYALAFINAEGSMDVRKYLALANTIAEREAAEDAEVALRHGKQLLTAVRDEIDIVRSLNASVRASYGIGGAA
jgi:hypothetical protein